METNQRRKRGLKTLRASGSKKNKDKSIHFDDDPNDPNSLAFIDFLVGVFLLLN